MCSRGSKLVILITGLCPANCFYCPLSFKKGGKDVIYADEWMLNDEDDVEKLIQEAIYIESEGAGITGGDPLKEAELLASARTFSEATAFSKIPTGKALTGVVTGKGFATCK